MILRLFYSISNSGGGEMFTVPKLTFRRGRAVEVQIPPEPCLLGYSGNWRSAAAVKLPRRGKPPLRFMTPYADASLNCVG
jgi:hypothetical protein